MTSIHHDLDLISQVDGWGTVTWHHKSLTSADLHEAWRGAPSAPDTPSGAWWAWYWAGTSEPASGAR